MAKRGDGGVDAAPRRRDGHAGGVVGMGEAPDQLIGKYGLVFAGVFAQELQDANGAIGCHRGGASRRGVVGFNSGFGHRAHVLSVLGGDGMEPRTRGFPRGAGRSGRSVVVGKRRVEFSTALLN